MRATLLTTVPLLALLVGLSGCDRWPEKGASGAEDHGHGHGSAARDHGGHEHDGEGSDPISVTLFTEKVQLFMEYPHLVKGERAEFLAHVTVLATGEPVRSGSMAFELTTPTGQVRTATWPAPRREGLFVPEWDFEQSGEHRLRLIVDSPQVQECIDVGAIVVHAMSHDAKHAAASAGGDTPPPNTVPFLLEQQWKIGLTYAPAQRRTLVHRLHIPGQIVAPQGASAAVSPPVAGRLQPPQVGRLPRIGDQVQAGQVLAMIEPPLPVSQAMQLSANRAQVQALESELALRELDLDTKALEVERGMIQAQAKLDYARRALERVEQLLQKGVGTEQQFDEARQNLRLAEAELEGAQAMKRSYERASERLARLRQRSVPQTPEFADSAASPALPMRAPITGEIVSVAHIEGEHLDDAHQEVFRIVNLEHVWVTASISEFDLASVAGEPGATMTLAAYPDRRFDILGSGGRLVHVGKIVDPETRAVSVTYEIPNREGWFRIGMFADVFLETEKATEVVAVPQDAVVMESGRPIAFVLHDGESFIKRELVTGIHDNGYVGIQDGVEPGERVVTQGAHALKLASMSPSSFGHGHVH